jgi:hypothetical protein
MTKEEKPVFFKAIAIVGVILIANVGILLYKYGNFNNFTGFSIYDNFSKIYLNIGWNTKMFLIAQWTVLFLALLIILVRDIKLGGRTEEIKIENKGTDLDALYNTLKEKKQLKISSIAKVFKVDKEIALEWGKTLEAGNLASVEYPGIGGPVLKIKE